MVAGKGVLLGWGSSMTDGGGILTDGKTAEGIKRLESDGYIKQK
jgi:hypothetical protein